jgi:RNA polymerase sigma-70 factor (ECF subfamily)
VSQDLRPALTALLPRLRRFALALTGSGADADELVQAACERVLRRAGQLRDQSRMDAWIYGIMRNLWIDEIRARRVRRHDDLEAAHHVVGTDGEAAAEGRITLAAVRNALQSLSADRRAVLILVCVDGLSYQEAASVLGIAVGTVMSRVSRARQELHERLSGAPDGDSVALFPSRPARSRPRPV